MPHLVCIDLAINHHPGSTAQLCARWQVDHDRATVGAQAFDNEGASLQAEADKVAFSSLNAAVRQVHHV